LTRDIGGRAVDGLVQRFGAAIGIGRTQRGRGQHPQRTRQHRGTIGQDIAEQVVGDDHVELFGRAHQLHRAVVGVHVGQLDIGVVFVMHLLHDFAPQDAAFHDIGFLHRADFVAPTTCQFKG